MIPLAIFVAASAGVAAGDGRAAAAQQSSSAACFPLLPPGTHAGVNGGPGMNAGATAAYAGIVASGGDLAQIGVTWLG